MSYESYRILKAEMASRIMAGWVSDPTISDESIQRGIVHCVTLAENILERCGLGQYEKEDSEIRRSGSVRD